MQLLLVEDDPHLGPTLATALARRYSVVHAVSLQGARRELEAQRFALYIIDIGLPDGSGIDLVRQIRLHNVRAAILILTVEHGTNSKVTGLDAGADDYLTKPFSLRELEARLRALARRNKQEVSLVRGSLVIDGIRRQAKWGNTVLPLAQRELTLLIALVESTGRVLSRDVLCDAIWEQNEVPASNALTVYMQRLRHALSKVTVAQLIHTVPGVGYVYDPDNKEASWKNS